MARSKTGIDKRGTMSYPERRWEARGFVAFLNGERYECMLYEPLTFNVPGGKYTPDFMLIKGDGEVNFIEVKEVSVSKTTGRRFMGKSYRDSRSKIRAAASLYPYFRFWMVFYHRDTDGWEIEEIKETIYIKGV